MSYLALVIAAWSLLTSDLAGAPPPTFGTDVCAYKLHKLSLLREIETLLGEDPSDPLEVRRTSRFARFALRELIEADAISVTAVVRLRDALRREAAPARALARLPEYVFVQSLAAVEGIRMPVPRAVALARVPSAHGPAVVLALAADGGSLFLGSRLGLEIWSTRDGRRVHGLEGDLAGAQAATFAAKGDRLFVTFRNRVGFASWSASDGAKQFSALQEKATSETVPPRPLTAEVLAVSPSGRRLATASWDDPRIFLWDLDERRGRWVKLPERSIAGIESLCWSRDGATLLVLSDTPGRLWRFDVSGNTLNGEVPLPFTDAKHVAVNETDGSLVVHGEHRGRVVTLSLLSGRLTRDFRTGLGADAVLSPDGRFVAGTRELPTGGGHRLEIWSIRHRSLTHAEPLREMAPHQVAFSADSRFVSVAFRQGTTHAVQTFRLENFELE